MTFPIQTKKPGQSKTFTYRVQIFEKNVGKNVRRDDLPSCGSITTCEDITPQVQ